MYTWKLIGHVCMDGWIFLVLHLPHSSLIPFHTHTQGDSSQKHPRPLDLLSPDPLPYLSAMLAYIHQLVAAEKEFVYAIFPPHTQTHTHAGRLS
ncbi:hypothetical protein EON63_12850 [archaeon]|nr:MAG: hypothetical protein EON63_12850 [archaeon]